LSEGPRKCQSTWPSPGDLQQRQQEPVQHVGRAEHRHPFATELKRADPLFDFSQTGQLGHGAVPIRSVLANGGHHQPPYPTSTWGGWIQAPPKKPRTESPSVPASASDLAPEL